MVYDAESDRAVLFGGGTFGLSDETWVYDFNTNTWRNMSPFPSPSARAAHMAYDAESDRVVLFSGFRGAGGSDDATWAYDFNSNTWTKMEPTTRPSPRRYSGFAYDAESDRVILFGGETPAGDNDETWAYDYNTDTWTKMEPTVRPSRRHGLGMAYDAESDRVVLFGGHRTSLFNDETWAYDYNTDTWTNMEPPTQPSKLAGHRLAYHAESDRVVLFGGDANPLISDETWAYDLNANTWTDLSPDGRG
jgi:N-acetylneuraminic acid mutarotase